MAETRKKIIELQDLRKAILEVSREVLDEMREEIIRRARTKLEKNSLNLKKED